MAKIVYDKMWYKHRKLSRKPRLPGKPGIPGKPKNPENPESVFRAGQGVNALLVFRGIPGFQGYPDRYSRYYRFSRQVFQVIWVFRIFHVFRVFRVLCGVMTMDVFSNEMPEMEDGKKSSLGHHDFLEPQAVSFNVNAIPRDNVQEMFHLQSWKNYPLKSH